MPKIIEQEKELEEFFLNNVREEISTPLNAVVGFNDLLNGVSGAHMAEDEKIVMREHIRRNANRLLTVVNDIIDLSKMQKGCLTLHKTVIGLMETCYKARESVKHEVPSEVKLKHEYPVALKDTYLYTDGKRLEQLIRILLENACQHTTSGEVVLKVKSFEALDDGHTFLQIRVDDTGEGIPEMHREHIFKPFWKVDQKSEGLGLGLTLGREIAKLLNGKVYLDHDYNGGASFVFEMPLEQL